ncbi:MAG: secretin N-terminal domain-containing protein [Verrucomicrobiota bacterium]
MKIQPTILLLAACFVSLPTLSHAQDAAPVVQDPVVAEPLAPTVSPEIGADAAVGEKKIEVVVDPNAVVDPNVVVDPNAPVAPLNPVNTDLEETPEGYIIKDAALNDIFQFLAKSAGRQYFHNLQINGPDFQVTGHLGDEDPLSQMEELAFMYGLSLHTKGNTIYALTQAQLSKLPSAEWHYQLQYLRPTDIEQIKQLIMPMLTPGAGIVNFEPKTNTIIIIDTSTRIEAARNLLHGIDKAKGQIIVETKILRINSSAGEKLGVNWADSLGNQGVPIQMTGQLGNLFGLPTRLDSSALPLPSPAGDFNPEKGSIILSPIQLSGVLKALNEGGVSNQVSNPTLITEDNEPATISIIDRIPIITSTTTPSSNGSATVSEEVRYKIDTSDKAITEDAENHREIGISIAVTPTLLPDGTIRMKMRPRSAQITGFVEGVGVNGLEGNSYPRVTESMVETLARIPDGDSLIVGGFYGEIQSNDKNKVPLFGDIPLLNFFFKSKETSKEQTSLVFIVTPTSYNPAKTGETTRVTRNLHNKTEFPHDYDSANPQNPGPGHEPNLRRTLRGMKPAEAPYYPRSDEFNQVDSGPSQPLKSKPSKYKR